MQSEQYRSIKSGTTVQAIAHATSENLATARQLVDTFGSAEMADEWLNAFCPALGVRPVELMEDDQGRRTINRVLICISHGIIY
jgi:uncharacterized protein (DUF2384 family)